VSRERWDRVKEIFEAALGLEPGRRAPFLAEACADDEELLREVESLLDAHEAAGTFIEDLSNEAAQLAENFELAPPYQRLGPYLLLGRIGVGGMGSVYRAVRDDEAFQKQVAVKIVSRGMNTEFILRRFRQERQILADLNHPNITMLLDGGATPDGLPYLVMEFVEGTPILAYCDQQNLHMRERLALFRTVCAAVQYAHSNRVVHRDLKPSNILVTSDGIPKLLDFGIAKIFDPSSGEEAVKQTISTRSLMTPEYASPEQVRGEPTTPASDIYSLGVLLYELLTWQRPYRIETPTPQKIAQAVCEQEPDKPSAIVTHLLEGAAKQVSSPRSVEPGLARKLRGDLDNIILTALHKEPDRRYGSVEALSEDIRRHLEGLPVSARPGSRAYRLAKFLRRHKTAMLTAALGILAATILMAGILTSLGIIPLAGKGDIVLITDPPEAEILLDDRIVGVTRGGSLRLTDLETGTHRMEVRQPGYISLKELIAVARGKNPERTVVLRPALSVLEIRTNQPAVQILVDGKERGITGNDGSAAVRDITPGLRSLSLLKEGFTEWKEEREFSADRTTEIHTALTRWEIDPKLSLLRISSDPPDANVIIKGTDGERKGVTAGGSFTLRDLKPGVIAVAMEKEGYQKKEMPLSLTAGQATTRHFVLTAKPALLDLVTMPPVAGVEVRIDGTDIGKTGAGGGLRVEVLAGKGPAVLEIAGEGYEREMQKIVFRPGVVEQVKIAMTARRGAMPTTTMLSVSSAPTGADVYLDETRIGITPLSSTQLAPGQHRITVRKKQHRDRSEIVQFLAGEPRALSYTLEKELGVLKLEVDPAETTATIDGQSYNTGTQKEILLSPGEHAVVLERPGYVSRRVKVTIADQRTILLRERLEAAGPSLEIGESYSDSFLNLNNWENQAGWQADGTLHVRGAGISLLKGRSFANFRQRLSLRLINGISASLLLRVRDAQNFYLIQLNGDSYWDPKLRSTILFHAFKEGSEIELASNALPVEPRKMRDWFQIFLEARGDLIKVSISGKILSGTTAREAELGRFRDPENLYPAGRIGFRAARNEVFEVNGLVIEPLGVTPPEK